MVNVSLFAYVADGHNGLHVVELDGARQRARQPRIQPAAESAPGRYTSGRRAIGISEGYRRDRGVDETGNQIAVFGRRGARPFNLAEAQKLFLRGGKTLWTVTDDPPKQ